MAVINALPAGSVYRFPAGDYTLGGAVFISNANGTPTNPVIVEGAGANFTTLNANAGGAHTLVINYEARNVVLRDLTAVGGGEACIEVRGIGAHHVWRCRTIGGHTGIRTNGNGH